MRHFDLTPLYRSTIGFDRLGSLLDTLGSLRGRGPELPALQYRARRRERVSHLHGGRRLRRARPRHRGEGEHTLHSRREEDREEDTTFLHRGIASRSFERRFQLADHVVVKGAAPRERLAACRSRARAARDHEAPHHPDRDQQRGGRAAQGHRQQGRLRPLGLCPTTTRRALSERAPFPCQQVLWERPAAATPTRGTFVGGDG